MNPRSDNTKHPTVIYLKEYKTSKPGGLYTYSSAENMEFLSFSPKKQGSCTDTVDVKKEMEEARIELRAMATRDVVVK